jgi:DNA end-binding protein Ku
MAMRSIWKGAISFGLVNVPVRVYSATQSHDVSLHQVHSADGGRIRYQRRCEVCNKVVKFEDIDKAYDDGNRTVVLTDEDFASLPAEQSREIDVVEFVPDDQIDPLHYDKAYYLEPDEKALKAYSLLREALQETDRTAIVTFALRQKTRLAALRVRGDVLVLQTLLWQDEVREAEFDVLQGSPKVSAKERDMAAQLVESMAADFDPGEFEDDYQVQLRQLVDAKLEQGDSLDTDATFGEQPEESGGADVVDLMEALKRSVDRRAAAKKGGAKASDDADEGESSGSSRKAPARKTAVKKTSAAKKTAAKKTSSGTAKKAPAKKTAAKKTTTKKTAAKKTTAKKTSSRRSA